MKQTINGILAGAGLFLAAVPFAVQADDGMMHRGGWAAQAFEMMDANHDGVVTRKEFDEFHDKRFKEMDANHDGKITREEMEAMHKKMGEQAGEHFKKRFEEADANHDGALSKEEAQKMPFIAQHFDEIDANHDGKVTQDEIKAAHGKMHGGQRGPMGGPMQCDAKAGTGSCGGHGGPMPYDGGMMQKK